MKATAELIAKGVNIDKHQVLVDKFGGTNQGWKKMKTMDDRGREVHWYEHSGVGKVGVKFKGQNDPF